VRRSDLSWPTLERCCLIYVRVLTGESLPVARKVGDHVFGCTISQNGLLYVKVTSLGSESALAQIVQLVESAQMKKAPVQAYADRLATMFTPTVLCIAIATFATWSYLASQNMVPNQWFADEYGSPLLFSMLCAISVIVISCPCALGLATPTAVLVGTMVGAHHGILFKGGEAFETAKRYVMRWGRVLWKESPHTLCLLLLLVVVSLGSVNTVVFDKTGTLTEWKPAVTDVIVVADNMSGEFIFVAVHLLNLLLLTPNYTSLLSCLFGWCECRWYQSVLGQEIFQRYQ
jgi:P-type Cu+ transporter